MIEKKIIAVLRASGINASTRLNPSHKGAYVLITRLGGERNYASTAPWNRNGYERVVIGFTVVDVDDMEAYALADQVSDIVEDLYFSDDTIVRAEVTGFTAIPLDVNSGITFQAEFIAQK